MRSASRAAPASAMLGVSRRPVEIDRPRRIGGVDARRQQTHEQPSERLQQREEQQRHDDVEPGMKIGNGAGGIGLERHQRRADPVQKSERQGAADDAVDQISDRQALGGRVAADPALKQWV
jgi:hypothetical protein